MQPAEADAALPHTGLCQALVARDVYRFAGLPGTKATAQLARKTGSRWSARSADRRIKLCLDAPGMTASMRFFRGRRVQITVNDIGFLSATTCRRVDCFVWREISPSDLSQNPGGVNGSRSATTQRRKRISAGGGSAPEATRRTVHGVLCSAAILLSREWRLSL